MNDYPIHPAALIFPEMDSVEFASLKADIEAHGQRDPVVLHRGQLLDGRHRARACRELGLPLRTTTWEGDDPIAYVVSVNRYRRHLTPAQLAMCAARARELYNQQAKGRQKARKGNQPGATKENLPDLGQARDQAGDAFGVSGRSVDYATKVLNEAVPEVVKAVDEGRMAVSTAAILASEPEEVQRREATNPRRNRNYKSCSKEPAEEEEQHQEDRPNGELKGKGVFLANEAINCLIRIPKNDPLRKRGFQIVTDWIRRNR